LKHHTNEWRYAIGKLQKVKSLEQKENDGKRFINPLKMHTWKRIPDSGGDQCIENVK